MIKRDPVSQLTTHTIQTMRSYEPGLNRSHGLVYQDDMMTVTANLSGRERLCYASSFPYGTTQLNLKFDE